MTDLIKVFENENNEPLCSGRELHEFLEVKEKYYQWFPRMVEYGFTENVDFTVAQNSATESTGFLGIGNPKVDHALTLDMAKEISMIQRSAKGKQARQYFIEVEKRYKKQPDFQIPQTLPEALRLAADQAEIIEVQKLLIQEHAPKVEFYDVVAESKGAMDIGQAAKVLNIPGIGPNNLFKILRKEKVFMPGNTPYQKYIDKGYFRLVELKYERADGSTGVGVKPVVFQKGLIYISRKLTEGVWGK